MINIKKATRIKWDTKSKELLMKKFCMILVQWKMNLKDIYYVFVQVLMKFQNWLKYTLKNWIKMFSQCFNFMVKWHLEIKEKFLNRLVNTNSSLLQELLKLPLLLTELGLSLIQDLILSWFMIRNIRFRVWNYRKLLNHQLNRERVDPEEQDLDIVSDFTLKKILGKESLIKLLK